MLGIGSVNPGLLQFAIDKFSQVYPDYRERVLRHEAAHLLLGYLLGVPVAAYSLSLGQVRLECGGAGGCKSGRRGAGSVATAWG